ncbi:hypothetical protein ACXZ1M_16685 [Duganella sp. PWIR1]
MKAIYIAKQLTLIATIGLAFSAHAQLLGGRGGPIGGMIGGSGAGSFGGMGRLDQATQMSGRGGIMGDANGAAEITRNSVRKSASTSGDTTAGGATSSAGASGNGSGSAGLGLETSGGAGALGSAGQAAGSAAQATRQGARTQAETTRSFAQASGANAQDTVGQTNAAGNARQIASAARATSVQPQLTANGNGATQGTASGNTAGNNDAGTKKAE